MKIRMSKKERRDLIKKLRPYWRKLKKLESDLQLEVLLLEEEMEKKIKIKGIQFFMCDGEYSGIGNADRTLSLISDSELE